MASLENILAGLVKISEMSQSPNASAVLCKVGKQKQTRNPGQNLNGPQMLSLPSWPRLEMRRNKGRMKMFWFRHQPNRTKLVSWSCEDKTNLGVSSLA